MAETAPVEFTTERGVRIRNLQQVPAENTLKGYSFVFEATSGGDWRTYGPFITASASFLPGGSGYVEIGFTELDKIWEGHPEVRIEMPIELVVIDGIGLISIADLRVRAVTQANAIANKLAEAEHVLDVDISFLIAMASMLNRFCGTPLPKGENGHTKESSPVGHEFPRCDDDRPMSPLGPPDRKADMTAQKTAHTIMVMENAIMDFKGSGWYFDGNDTMLIVETRPNETNIDGEVYFNCFLWFANKLEDIIPHHPEHAGLPVIVQPRSF